MNTADLSVSVIIPTHNRAGFITRAVSSALAAVGPRDEILVIDDGSTDGTEEVLAPYRYRIRYFRTARGGAGAARNRGLAEACKPLVAFLDSDDEWFPWRLDLARAILAARPDVLFSFSNFESDFGNTLRPRALCRWQRQPKSWDELAGPGSVFSSFAPLPPGWPDFNVHIGDIYLTELTVALVCSITLTARREEAADALRFPENVPTYEDRWCAARLAKRGTGAYLDCDTALQHCHRRSRLTDLDTLTCADVRLRLLREIWGRDETFLRQHGQAYTQAIVEQRVRRAKGLIAAARPAEARAEIAALPGAPALYRLLAALPGPVLAGLFELRTQMQRVRVHI